MSQDLAQPWPYLRPQRHTGAGLSVPAFLSGIGLADHSEMPSQRDIEEVFGAAEFAPIVHQVVRQVIAPDWGRFVDKMRLRADSFLARLPDWDFEQGMIALQWPGGTIDQREVVTEEIGWFVFARPG